MLGEVHAIAAAPNGITWFGTSKGLYRSDTPDSPPVKVVKRGLLSGGVWSLLFDRDGLLWIGTENGVARFDGQAWSLLDQRDGLPGRVVYAIEQAADGAIWLGTDGGLVRYRRTRSAPSAPLVVVSADGSFGELAEMTSLLEDRRTTFQFSAADAATPARTAGSIASRSSPKSLTLQPSVRSSPILSSIGVRGNPAFTRHRSHSSTVN